MRIFLIIVLTGTLVHAQSLTGYREEVRLTTSQSLFVTGETCYFSIEASHQPKSAPSSKVAYIELLGPDLQPTLQVKVPLNDDHGNGDFFLNSTLSTGEYTLVAYTKAMVAQEQAGAFVTRIVIINPFRIQTQQGMKRGHVASNGTAIASSTNGLQIHVPDGVIGKRQGVTVEVPVPPDVHHVTVSVQPVETYPGIMGSERISLERKPTLVPEWRGQLISGILRDSTGSILPGKATTISVPGKDYHFYSSLSLPNGRFFTLTENLFDNRTISIQADQKGSQIELDPDFIGQFPSLSTPAFMFEDSLSKHIEARSMYAQIENAYFARKKDSTVNVARRRFFGKPDKVYRLNDFTRFPTMEDVFREIVLEVIVRKRENAFELKVMDWKTRLPFQGNPIVLIDGIWVRNIQEVMEFDPALVENISIVTRRYFLGTMDFSGIISIETFEGKAPRVRTQGKVFNYQGLQSGRIFYQPDYDKNRNELERIPDFRVQLYWNPSLKITNQKGNFRFFTSDVSGKFVIHVSGVLPNGEYTEAFHVVTVEP